MDSSSLGWVLPLPAEDRQLSPETGFTREHWATVADNLLLGVRPYRSMRGARIDLAGYPARAGMRSDGLEGFAIGRGNRTVPITFSVGLLLAACTAGSPHQSLFSRPASRRRARRAVTRNCVSRTTPTIATTAAPATAAMNSAVPSGRDPVKPR